MIQYCRLWPAPDREGANRGDCATPEKAGSKSLSLTIFPCQRKPYTLDRLHEALQAECREAPLREANLTAAISDSQSTKSAEKGTL